VAEDLAGAYRSTMRCALLILVLIGCGGRSVPASAPRQGDPALSAILERARVRHALPAVGALRMDEGGITRAVVGFRSLDTLEPIELDDAFHLGSTAKAMTATVAAALVEDELLDWEQPLPEVFPWVAVHPGYSDVTLADLATHRAGLPRDLSASDAEREAFDALPDVRAQRRVVAERILSDEPASTPRRDMSYSNVGYVLLGLAIEEAAGAAFEDVVRARLFEPLGMRSCGFSSQDPPDVPRGHDALGRPLPSGPSGDLPPVYASAGLVHCSLADWARFADDHVRGAHGEPALLTAASYARLHESPPESSYSFGWGLARSDEGRLLSHAGSNGSWKALIMVHLDARRVVLLATNIAAVSETSLVAIMREIETLE
jgi:D-alanyl-D-alanine carboxypeptidase